MLDIGPKVDGTIPVIMEERLTQIGDWLKINGDAIYGTKPWKATQQWSPGEVPKVEYNKEYSTPYDVTKLTEKPESGKAGIEAFFTAKGSDLYAILPHWSDHSFLLKDVTGAKSVSLLGSTRSSRGTPFPAGVGIEGQPVRRGREKARASAAQDRGGLLPCPDLVATCAQILQDQYNRVLSSGPRHSHSFGQSLRWTPVQLRQGKNHCPLHGC